jgi:hypothetical protein
MPKDDTGAEAALSALIDKNIFSIFINKDEVLASLQDVL